MRLFLLPASVLVALAVLLAAGAATAKAPPKHKRTVHATAATAKKLAKAKPARAKATAKHVVVPTTAAPVVDEDDDLVEDQAEDVDNRGPGNAEDDQGVEDGQGVEVDNSGPGSSHSGHSGGGGDDHGGDGHGGGGGDD